MARRSAATMARAHETVDRLLAAGVSHHAAARKAGVAVQTVRLWAKAGISEKITNTNALRTGPISVPEHINQLTWQETLDAAWDTRRRVGGRERYRATLREWALSFDEASDPLRIIGTQQTGMREVTFYCDDGSRRRVMVRA